MAKLILNCRVLESGRATITSRWADKLRPDHKGVDIVSVNDELKNTTAYVLAHSDGVVTAVERNVTTEKTGYGNYVKIDHGNGYSTLYAHLKAGTVTLKVGDKVTAGQRIGYMGATGEANGAHLHFEVRLDGTPVDPVCFLGAPDFIAAYAEPQPEPPKEIKVGDTVQFTGTKQYTNAGQADNKGKSAKPCSAKVTRIYRLGKAKHPYNLEGSGVHGWCDEKDVKAI